MEKGITLSSDEVKSCYNLKLAIMRSYQFKTFLRKFILCINLQDIRSNLKKMKQDSKIIGQPRIPSFTLILTSTTHHPRESVLLHNRKGLNSTNLVIEGKLERSESLQIGLHGF